MQEKQICRKYHQARWVEPLIMEKSSCGERGIMVPRPGDKEKSIAGDVKNLIPSGMERKNPPCLPSLSQMQILRHYLRLSQETIGADLTIDIGQGTCTMKYSPKVHETLVRLPEVAALHPYQPEETIQGILKIFYDTTEFLKEISGMDYFSLQPSSGSQAIYGAVSIMRAYHRYRGEEKQRSQIITTMLSHPGNPGCAATAGFNVINLYPGEDGLPDLDEFRKIVSEQTAGLLITNPEDSGLFNHRIREFVDLVHAAGGLCFYDQANLNGLFGITRAREANFDMCHFNLHKTFSSPHGSHGPGAGALGVRHFLADYLPLPVVEKNEEGYKLNYDRPLSIGKLRKFYGVAPVVVRAYAYIRMLGSEGLKQISELSILNNNYMLAQMADIPGLSLPWAQGVRRFEQARLSWEELTRDTGVTTDDINRRILDYGLQTYFTSHHPRLIKEPFTPEPVETYSKEDIDRYVEVFRTVAREAYDNPELAKTAPHCAAMNSQIDESFLNDINKFACTWRSFKKHVAPRLCADEGG